VVNKTTGDKIEMARVKIEGINKGGFTDSTGSFSIQGVKAGVYTITCSVDEMGSDTLRNITINANATTTIDFQFKSSIKTLKDFKITVEKNKETVNETEKMKQKNPSVIEIIGKETFNKSPNCKRLRVSTFSPQAEMHIFLGYCSCVSRINSCLIQAPFFPSPVTDGNTFTNLPCNSIFSNF
jgi:hypothetical protein